METPLCMEQLSITDKLGDKSDYELINWPKFRTIPEGRPYWYLDGSGDRFMILGEERVRIVTTCADIVLAEFNRNNNTDYKLCHCQNVIVQKLCVGRFRVHCNFSAKAKGEIRQEHFFAEAEFKDGSCTIIHHDVLISGKVKKGCDVFNISSSSGILVQGRPRQWSTLQFIS